METRLKCLIVLCTMILPFFVINAGTFSTSTSTLSSTSTSSPQITTNANTHSTTNTSTLSSTSTSSPQISAHSTTNASSSYISANAGIYSANTLITRGSVVLTTTFSSSSAGVIYTTTSTGSSVNENTSYKRLTDVFLAGGSGKNDPSTNSGLPIGDYYFQVTSPDGKFLLSTDSISCRAIHVNNYGVISSIYSGTNYIESQGKWHPEFCQHNYGIDKTYPNLGAIIVQLYPFSVSPDPKGDYKVWLTPVASYQGNSYYVPTMATDSVTGTTYTTGNYYGFLPQYSKTYNFRVKTNTSTPVTPTSTIQASATNSGSANSIGISGLLSSTITIETFNDINMNGQYDSGVDQLVTGWPITITDPLGVSTQVTSTATITVSVIGTYIITESQLAGITEIGSTLDGVQMSLYPTASAIVDVTIIALLGESHTIMFGNVGLGQAKVCKINDTNQNGVVDPGEQGIANWEIQLAGTLANGQTFTTVTQYTGTDGCTTFSGLFPGSYSAQEIMQPNWVATTATTKTFAIASVVSGSTLVGSSASVYFTNYYSPPSTITIEKFNDINMNGKYDAGVDQLVTGWPITVVNPLGVSTQVTSTATITASVLGTYVITESQLAGTAEIGSTLDGVQVSLYPTASAIVDVTITGSGESHTVMFGNVGLGQAKICAIDKITTLGLVNWAMQLSGTLANGQVFTTVTQYTGTDGCTTFNGLFPGSYSVQEQLQSGWVASTTTTEVFTIASVISGSTLVGSSISIIFVNLDSTTSTSTSILPLISSVQGLAGGMAVIGGGGGGGIAALKIFRLRRKK